MRRAGSHFSNNLRLRSGIFYLYLLLILTLGFRLWLPGIFGPDREELFEEDKEFMHWLARQDSVASLTGYEEMARAPLRQTARRQEPFSKSSETTPKEKQDLNLATAAILQEVRGIGPVLSKRIVRFRDALGGFFHESQLFDVYGLPPEVAKAAMQQFTVKLPPDIPLVNINTATPEELSRLIYWDLRTAGEIVRYRELHGNFTQAAELAGLLGMPQDKVERIALYLQF